MRTYLAILWLALKGDWRALQRTLIDALHEADRERILREHDESNQVARVWLAFLNSEDRDKGLAQLIRVRDHRLDDLEKRKTAMLAAHKQG